MGVNFIEDKDSVDLIKLSQEDALSFVANEDITEGTAVAGARSTSLTVCIRAIDPLNFADARSVGIAVDTVS